MKRVREPIDVQGRDHQPQSVEWNGRHFVVQRIIETWVVQGRWWSHEEKRIYFRLVLAGKPAKGYHQAYTLVATIYYAKVEGKAVGWMMESIMD